MAINPKQQKEKRIKVDSRGKISLKSLVPEEVTSYKAKLQDDGTILLRPIMEVEYHPEEAWLFKNPKALKMVKEGLEAAEKGEVTRIDESFWNEVDALPDEEDEEE